MDRQLVLYLDFGHMRPVIGAAFGKLPRLGLLCRTGGHHRKTNKGNK
jgi:hypothetical protein